MEAVREEWTDGRLDDLNHRVDSGFNAVSREFQALRMEMRTEFVAVRSEMGTTRSELSGQIAAQNRMMVQLFGGMFATMVVGFLGTIATVIAQG
jgi:hypothetical protein